MHEQSGQGHPVFSLIELAMQEQSGQGHSTVVSKFLVLGKLKFTEYNAGMILDSVVSTSFTEYNTGTSGFNITL
ncbi:hypothetical protein EJD97_012278, partial [Solanum chilense]